MHTAFALDLKVARRKSGLSQHDCAHLLDCRQQRISQLEIGSVMPTVPEICTLSLVFGKTFNSLFEAEFVSIRQQLRDRLETLPSCKKNWLGRFNRRNTISKLADRLTANNPMGHGGL